MSRPQGHSAAGKIMSMTPSVIEPTTFRLFVSQPTAPLISVTRTPRAAFHVQHEGFPSPSLGSFAGTAWSGETPFAPRPYLPVHGHSNGGRVFPPPVWGASQGLPGQAKRHLLLVLTFQSADTVTAVRSTAGPSRCYIDVTAISSPTRTESPPQRLITRTS